jgi:hypothetical protein
MNRMLRAIKSGLRVLPVREDGLGAIRAHMAQAIIGSEVDLLVDATHITHGVVTGVFNEAGTPKLVVDGSRYDLDQILTVAPASHN